jgi:uncharacterized repeat protein (TIGR04138 family)
MSDEADLFQKLLQADRRYRPEAYRFVSEALIYAQNCESSKPVDGKRTRPSTVKKGERHLTGRQLCDAIRELAMEQFGLMTPVVFRSWGVHSTSDFGEIVYNLIEIGRMKKSHSDRREDFNGVYDFDDVFHKNFRMTPVENEGDHA